MAACRVAPSKRGHAMKITALRLRRLRGTVVTNGPVWEERLVRPIDIYPEYQSQALIEGGVQVDAAHFRIEAFFVQIETDTGVVGIAGPIIESVAYIVAN